MTVGQFAVCGFLFWPVISAIDTLLRGNNYTTWDMIRGGCMTGIVGAGLGVLWNL